MEPYSPLSDELASKLLEMMALCLMTAGVLPPAELERALEEIKAYVRHTCPSPVGIRAIEQMGEVFLLVNAQSCKETAARMGVHLN